MNAVLQSHTASDRLTAQQPISLPLKRCCKSKA